MAGTIALVGAGEFLEGMAETDRYLMTQAPTHPPLVVVLPTAAGAEDNPHVWSDMGVTHFRHLGANAEAVLVIDHITADDSVHAEMVRRSDFVYLSGGSPGHLLHSLQDTKVWAAILEVYQRGGVLAGCSAGAMVMGGLTRVRRGSGPGGSFLDWDWEAGLSLLPGAIVAPHFNRMTGDRLRGFMENSPEGHVVIGVDEHTAAVGDGNSWVVMGRGGVSIFQAGSEQRYPSGTEFTLPIL